MRKSKYGSLTAIQNTDRHPELVAATPPNILNKNHMLEIRFM
jgi:hypothetical protein